MADYFVPLFWMGVLSPEDELVKEALDEDDPDDYLLYIDVSPTVALARFQDRAEALAAIVERIPGDHETARDSWVRLLTLQQGTLRFDVTEVLTMNEESEEMFRLAKQYFEAPTKESAAAIIGVTCIDDVISGTRGSSVNDYLLGYQR